jgi:dinuclear metal center YbgI/SA1388 family protein
VHHPIIFVGLKSLTGKTYIERTVIKAIKNNIAIYAAHTNLDNINTGVSKKICDKLKLINTHVLSPKKELLQKMTVFVPLTHAESLRDALKGAGAGSLGNYKGCSFSVEGTGRFIPSENANPFIGERGSLEIVKEERIEVLYPSHMSGKILSAMKEKHPYEEVSYFLEKLENNNFEVGSGMVGELEEEIPSHEFMEYLKDNMDLNVIRHTAFVKDKIKTIAVCGGAGSFLLPKAKQARADVFITGDFKYHEFFDAENDLIIADIGHYESEVYTKELFYELLTNKFPNIAFASAETSTNPIVYHI